MSDSSIVLNAGSGGDSVDAELIGSVKRERQQLGGAALAEVAQVKNADITSGQGLAVRQILHTAPATATLSNVSNSVTSAQALASNTAREGASFFNDDTAASVYLKWGTTASATSYTVKIAPGQLYELPFTRKGVYTGRIDVIATAATGTLRVTELT